jgi:hypothetical protein
MQLQVQEAPPCPFGNASAPAGINKATATVAAAAAAAAATRLNLRVLDIFGSHSMDGLPAGLRRGTRRTKTGFQEITQ